MTTLIRPMQREDFAACQILWRSDEHVHAALADNEHDFARYLERNPNISQVAVVDDIVVGAIAAGHDGFRGSCHHLIVATTHRRLGLGKQLAAASLAALKQAGITRCFVWVYASNSEGSALWQDLGFECWGDSCPTWSKSLADEQN